MLSAQILVLLFAANGGPIITERLLGKHCPWPVDGGARFIDGRPLLGPSKTWRGLVGAIVCAALAAGLFGFSPATGMLVGAGAMLGDLLSSFIKRRLGIDSSGMALVLDQVPESLFPLLMVRSKFGLAESDLVGLVTAFVVLELILSRILFWLHIRRQPY